MPAEKGHRRFQRQSQPVDQAKTTRELRASGEARSSPSTRFRTVEFTALKFAHLVPQVSLLYFSHPHGGLPSRSPSVI